MLSITGAPRTGGRCASRARARLLTLAAAALLFLPVLRAWDAPWYARHNLTAAQYDDEFDRLNEDGWQLRRVQGYLSGGSLRYLALWEFATGPRQWVRARLTKAQFDAADLESRNAGYRIAYVSGYTQNGVTYYDGIWEQQASPARVVDVGLTGAQYQALFDARSSSHRLLLVNGFEAGGQSRYAAIWEVRAGLSFPLAASHGGDEATFNTDNTNRYKEGYTLNHLSVWDVGGQQRFAAIWVRAGKPSHYFHWDQTSANYQDLVEHYADCGHAPRHIFAYNRGAAARFGGIWQFPSTVPASGVEIAELRALDTTMRNYMRGRGIQSGTLCVARNGTIVYERGFGWRDRGHATVLPPNALMRIASLSKPLTVAAVQRLVADGQLRMTNLVFKFSASSTGLLPYTAPAGMDTRIRNITVRHLVDHQHGWLNSDSGLGDPVFNAREVAEALGVASPATREQVVQHMLKQGLSYAPGTTGGFSGDTRYSNFGYMLLGLVIQRVTGVHPAWYLDENILRPVGVPDADFQQAATLPEYRSAREPFYADSIFRESMYSDAQIPRPDGTYSVENLSTAGGLLTTTRAYVRFLNGYRTDGTRQTTFANGGGWTFNGSLPGTTTCSRRRSDGVNYAVFFNQRTSCNDTSDPPGWHQEIHDLLTATLNGIGTWPTRDPAGLPLTVRPRLDLVQTIELDDLGRLRPKWAFRLPTTAGRIYRIESSTDLKRWAPLDTDRLGRTSFTGDGEVLELPLARPLRAPRAEYFRVVTDEE